MQSQDERDLHTRIRKARRRARLNQSELAHALGISPSSVSQWEAADPEKRTTPRDYRLRQIASVCGVSANWLMRGEGGMEAPKKEIQGEAPRAGEEDDLIRFISYITNPKYKTISPQTRKLIDFLREADAEGRLRPQMAEMLHAAAKHLIDP